VIDNCGVCDNDPTNDCTQDCYGIWGGNAISDCAGICEGTAKYDCDNNCISQNDSGEYIGTFPLEGECDCDGNLPDECGICGGAGALYSCGCFGLPQLAYGGDAATNNFTILGQNNFIRGVSFNIEDDSEDGFEENSYGIINPGFGTLTHLEIIGTVEYLDNILIERPTPSSNTVVFDYYIMDYCTEDNEPTAENLPDNTFYITSNNDVLYNSTVEIRSFEFTIIGGGVVSRACSCSGGTYDCHYIPNECINGHGFTEEECENAHCVGYGVTANCHEDNPCDTQEECENIEFHIWYPAGVWDLNDECSILYSGDQINCENDAHCAWDVNEENPEDSECVISGNEACIESATRLDDIDNDGICDTIDECVTISDIESSCGNTEDEHGREYCGCIGEFGAGEYRCPVYDCSGICGGNNRQDTFDSNFDLQIVKDTIEADSLRLKNCLYYHDVETCCGENSTSDGPNFCNDSETGEINDFNEYVVDERCGCNKEAQNKPDDKPFEGYGCCCEETRDCSGICSGSNIIDECGVCAGDSSTCEDCLGVPNGTAVFDVCGVCQGDNSSCSGCDGIVGSGLVEDCSGECGGSAINDECGVCNGDGIPDGIDVCLRLEEDSSSDLYNLIYSSTQEIAGIQFNHNGCINSISGGQAGNAGWILSSGASTALGFSFSGSVLPIGTNLVLTQLSLEQNGENNIGDCIFVDDCLTNIDECAFSNPAGDYLTIIYSSNP